MVDADGTEVRVGVVPEAAKVDPTGVGDGFRAGFLTRPPRRPEPGAGRAARASLVAVLVLETDGTQEWTLDAGRLHCERLAEAYGSDAADEIAALL